MTFNILHQLAKEDLSDLNITVLGDMKNILGKPKASSTSSMKQASSGNVFMKASAVKPPQLNDDMTLPQFRKSKQDWDVFKSTRNPDSCTVVQWM